MIVVTGATGNIGRPLTRALAEAGERVTAVSRHPAPVPDGVRHLTADLAEPAALEPVLTGAKALFLLLSGDLHGPGTAPAELVGRAAAAGVRRIVLLSTQGVVTRPFGATRIAMRALEDAVRESVPEWAIVRPGGFASNALWWAESVRTGRTVAAPFGDLATPVVDPADIAEVAAACLLEDRQIGGVYELTGPEVISPRGQTAALSAALGVPLRFHELSRAEAGAAMARSMPVELADDTLDILGAPSAAELRIGPGVREVLGRDPRSFADWAARHVDAFR
ncbi:SDR family oxidoreductase [Kitasatospora purpeofusca]|uniref:SDR family oxidoreductase n=1 Tax=Kitasatospora purpeofusca TaxID=67352 RepID=UPI002A5A04DD|nr:NAD(P)H-binding protein [Kitasatospora purpeofusca]MDY0815455.1 NAD(P)H-binding protein [Kitasatospora purpeofusca]